MAKKNTTMASLTGNPKDDENPSGFAKKAPAKKDSPRKYTKGGGRNIETTVDSSTTSTGLNVYVLRTKSDDILLFMERPNGTPPYVAPTETYLRNNRAFMRETLMIHQIHNQVDPSDPEKPKAITSANGYRRRWPVMVNIVASQHIPANTTENRTAWGESFVNFFNHPHNQARYTYPVKAAFAGDITATIDDHAHLPYASDYLTVSDTMMVMREAIMEPGDVELKSIGDCLDLQEAMEEYYSPNALAIAMERYSHLRNHVPPGALPQPVQNGQNPPDNRNGGDADIFHNVQPFHF